MQQPVAVVVAHADDETIGAGACLKLFEALTIVHVTDGAPRNLHDAHTAGFASAGAYAKARQAEFAAAMQAGGVAPHTVKLGVADQAASLSMRAIAQSLAALFQREATRLVLTHPYEGGHPDHDATCRAVHAACAQLGDAAPQLIEMAFYHAPGGIMQTGGFLPGPAPTVLTLSATEQARKRAMLACFTTQQATLAAFATTHEPFRPAPRYDFTQPPHSGTLHYERHDWGMTGARWRALAAQQPARLQVYSA